MAGGRSDTGSLLRQALLQAIGAWWYGAQIKLSKIQPER